MPRADGWFRARLTPAISTFAILHKLWGGPPGPRVRYGRLPRRNQYPAHCKKADQGVGRGPGGPPHG
jgi:hypothetical protein